MRAVDADGGAIGGNLDAMLTTGEWVGTDDLAYAAVNCLIGENLLSNWDYCPNGYERPDYDITFTCDENGNITITSGNAEVVVLDDITYIVVTLEANNGTEPDLPGDNNSKIVIDMTDSYGASWNGAAIEIYKNGTLIETATIASGATATTELSLDSTASYEFKWAAGGYDEECFFVIYVDDEKVVEGNGDDYDDGQTILIFEDGVASVPEESIPSKITGVSITVDGETYTEGPVVITPESNVIITITGTNFERLRYRQQLLFAPEHSMSIDEYGSLDTDNDVAVWDFTGDIGYFMDCDGFEMVFTNGNWGTLTNTGIYLTFTNIVPDSTGKIVIDMHENYGDGWNGAAIEIYKNGTLEATVSIESRYVYSEIAEFEYDPTAAYEFKWISASYDKECGIYIYVDGETKLELKPGKIGFVNGETILTLEGIATTLKITKQPESASAKLGDVTSFHVEAVGDGLTYQWFYRNVGDIRWSVSAFTTDTYAIEMTIERAARELYCQIRDEYGNTVTTEIIQMIGVPSQELKIITQPNDAEAYLGDAYCSTIVAQGDGLQYRWFFRDAGTESWKNSDVKDETYDYGLMTEVRNGREVYCVITDVWGNSVESEIATITAIARDTLRITSQPKNAEAHLGEAYCTTVIAQGEGLTYQWYFRNEGDEKFEMSSIRDNTYDFGLLTVERHNREVYCVITDVWGNTVTTDIVKIVGIPSKAPEAQLKILSQPQNAAARLGESYCSTVVAQGEGLTYQWYFRNAGSEEWIESAVRDNTYNYGLMTKERNGREVYCVITDVWGNTVTTDVVKIVGIPETELKILSQPQNIEVKMGQRYSVDVIAQGEGLTYQWYYRNAGTEQWMKSAICDSSYDYGLMTAARNGRQVYCVITDAWGNIVTTEIVTLSIISEQN